MKSMAWSMLLLFAAPCTSSAETINVPSDQPTITAAVAAAGVGDTIFIEAGTYFESSIFISSADLTISGATHGDGSPAVTLDGSGVNDILLAIGIVGSEGATVQNIVFTGSLGNALWIYHMDPVIRNCVFTGNSSEFAGGALWSSDSEAVIEDCRFVGNDGGDTGSIFFTKSNSSGSPGPTVRGCVFENNTAYSAAMIQFCQAAFENCTFRGNTATSTLSSWGSGGLVSVSGTLFCENEGADIDGPWDDGGGNQFQDICPVECPGDITGDNVVNVTDLLGVIAGWGDPYDVSDLLTVIGAWGACP